eukprot:Partr_v1_DN27574_c3_g1_i1_m30398 putative Nuclear cap-binding protein subunit
MASLLPSLAAYSKYKHRYYKGDQDTYKQEMDTSTTLYIGNLSFFTTEEQIYELLSHIGEIQRVIMGLDRHKKTPCGFCFVQFYRRVDAVACMQFVNGMRLDDRPISTDLDPGFRDGRQFGRGKSGGQVADEKRETFDAGRGGYGARMRGAAYDDTSVPSGGRAYAGLSTAEARVDDRKQQQASKKKKRDADEQDGDEVEEESRRRGARMS